jgi:Flp pilus assembly pilin Flp
VLLCFWIDRVVHRLVSDSSREESGATLVEYTLLLVLVAIAAFVAMQFVGSTVSNSLNNSGNSLFSP